MNQSTTSSWRAAPRRDCQSDYTCYCMKLLHWLKLQFIAEKAKKKKKKERNGWSQFQSDLNHIAWKWWHLLSKCWPNICLQTQFRPWSRGKGKRRVEARQKRERERDQSHIQLQPTWEILILIDSSDLLCCIFLTLFLSLSFLIFHNFKNYYSFPFGCGGNVSSKASSQTTQECKTCQWWYTRKQFSNRSKVLHCSSKLYTTF